MPLRCLRRWKPVDHIELTEAPVDCFGFRKCCQAERSEARHDIGSFDSAGQRVVALNRKMERSISTGFDLATRLASAKNLVEAIQLQAAYWRKQSDELRMQLEEVTTELGEAFARYFGYRANILQRELNELFLIGRRTLAVGRTILVACLLLSQIAARHLTEGPFRRLVEQSLPILGWVANWRPLEIFLYDWWPLARRRDLYRRLSAATVETKAY